MRTVLVTGAAGRVGRRLVAALDAGGWEVRRFDLADGDDIRDETRVRPVLVLDDDDLRTVDRDALELDAFVHVDDVASAVVNALTVPVDGCVRAILCGSGEFDASAARERLGWQPARGWPAVAC